MISGTRNGDRGNRMRGTAWFAAVALFLATADRAFPASIDTLSGWSGAITATFGDDAGENPGGTTFGQTFTMPQNALLTSVAFGVQGYAPYTAPQACTFEAFVMAWNGSRPTGPVLFQSSPQTMPLGFYPTVDFNLPINNVSVNAGSQYVLFLTSNDFLDGIRSDAAVKTVFDTYSGGTFVTQYPGNSISDLLNNDWSQESFLDLAFQVNYTPTPEPSACAMLGLGLAAMLRARSKRLS